ncbi:MAG: rhodanese-like domain-containing protein [Gammaproteobacteria bacterium]
MINDLNPRQTWEFMQQHPDAVMIDVRTKMEHSFVGHPLGAVSIPWKEFPDWQLNPNFVALVRQIAPDYDTPLLFLCRSGQRSLDAAKAMQNAGYRQLFNIIEGFEGPLDGNKHRGTSGGWRFHGLPWEQS